MSVTAESPSVLEECVMGLLEMTQEHGQQLQEESDHDSPLKLKLVYHPFYSTEVCMFNISINK